MIIFNFVSIVLSVFIIFLSYCKWKYQYWNKKNVSNFQPQVPFGNILNTITGREHLGITLKNMYQKMKAQKWKHGGIYIFTSPNYVPIDLNYITNITTTDFQYFTDHAVYRNEKKDPLNAHLIYLNGAKWRNLRTKLSPTFTSMKIKTMFQIMIECQNLLLQRMNDERNEINIKEIVSEFSADIIESCVFSLNCKSIQNKNSPIRKNGKLFFHKSKFSMIKRMFCTSFPEIALMLNLSIVSKETTQTYTEMIEKTVTYRKKNNYRRNDFLQLLIDLKISKNEKVMENLTIQEIAAQSFAFYLGGFETSFYLMTFSLYELAKNQELQKKARDEVNTILEKHNGDTTYEAIQDMKYLDQVIKETSRKYPAFPYLTRKCVQDYKIPDEDVIIEKGTTILIPILGIHYDEEYYPDPEKFEPDRYSTENKSKRHGSTFLGFGEGPRSCIGKQFGMVQTKVALSCLLKHYNFSINSKTKEPIKIRPNSVVLTPVSDIWLNVQKL